MEVDTLYDIGQKVWPIFAKIEKGDCPNCDGTGGGEDWRCLICDGQGEISVGCRWFVGVPFEIVKIKATISKEVSLTFWDSDVRVKLLQDMQKHAFTSDQLFVTQEKADFACKIKNEVNDG